MEKQFYQKLINTDTNSQAALCSVLDWKGSVPRKDYPMMLVKDSGEIVGTIGGGSMENEVIQKAITLMNTDKPQLKEFDYTNDDCSAPGGMCGGKLTILIEPFSSGICEFWKSVNFGNSKNIKTRIVTEVNTTQKMVERYHWNEKNHHELLPSAVIKTFSSSLKSIRIPPVDVDQSRFFSRPLISPPVLHIFGGGHVGKAVGDLAHFIDLDFNIYDDREEFCSAERFPNAIMLIKKPLDSFINEPPLPSPDLALIATRGHKQDLDLMRWLIKNPPSWLGLVSSKRKWKILSKALLNEGVERDLLENIHAPVGMKISAETVPEIAVSIIGDIIRHVRKMSFN